MRLRASQHGAVLIIGLIMLLVVTMIGLTAMQTSTQQERMAGNLHDRNLATQAAEATVRVAEEALTAGLFPFTVSLVNGRFDIESVGTSAPDPLLDDWAANRVVLSADERVRAATAAVYRIEKLPNISFTNTLEAGKNKELEVFTVTARAQGARANTVSIIQNTYTR
ncbi:pilus assembly PilX family protein [Thauera propionica]|uniref:pilus assembly PilX family protein n=1 Tax=Thauera propionica TaxID=2019431 RepID=UPI0013FD4178|nr:PilX N-terminal domain-containing pilus assembly protein [Thauera propionica]